MLGLWDYRKLFKFCPFFFFYKFLYAPYTHFLKLGKHRKEENKLPKGTQLLSAF